ncbi:MAG: elongation factor EF-2 [Thermoplasmata archaeon HGW-Thermoplasmata-1]|nr:MAG: elongation factor EF-2 [Thermoplasmata archaeon HGW-Thermoplasmata-1]
MGRKEDNIKLAKDIMHMPDFIRNIGIAAHIDHGKTTFSDNLIAGAGMMSEELAGKQCLLDYDEQEQARGITINAASASMVHTFDGKNYLINLIDTPGHVDFGGDVTRAMRAVDGAIVLSCAVEGVMPQTETVLRQAIKEKVKPVLFINKVDRLINELKVTPEQMQQRFMKIIAEVNRFIRKMAPKEYVDKWQVNVLDGSVAFGSAYHNWGISVPYMKKTGITFKDITDYCNANDQKALAKRAPIHQVVLDMVIHHLPNPAVAQKYRIPNIWHGDLASEQAKHMMNCDEKAPLALMVTKIILDPHAGEVAFGRVYSGAITRGQEVYISGATGKSRVQQVAVMVGADRVPVEEVVAGNIAAVTGLREAIAGSTVLASPDMEPFEKISHYSDPVVTVAIEAKHMADLPKLVEVLRSVAKADPSIQVEINQETGEHLMSGMGELHLEITQYRIEKEHNVPIKASTPIVVYRETVNGMSPEPFEGKSPNKHNRFYITAEPLDEKIMNAIHEGEFPSDVKKHKDDAMRKLVELGMEKDVAKGVVDIKGTNLFLDVTKGIQYLFETRELIKEAFAEVMKRGPRANEPVQGTLFKLHDAKLHEDAVHRGPAQVIPAVRNALYGCMTTAGPVLLEPLQKVVVSVPQDIMGNVTREMQQRRGNILDMTVEGDMTSIESKAPVGEMFGFSGAIRSATGGRCLWSTENIGFEMLPPEFQEKITREIRERKGLKPEPYTADYYSG